MKQLKTAIMYGVSAVVACIIRICQLLFMTDAATGFFYPRYETLGALLTVLYLLILAATAVVAYLEMRGSVRRTVRSTPGVIVLALAGIITVAGIADTFAAAANLPAKLLYLVVTVGCAAFFFIEAAAGLKNVGLPVSLRQWMSVFPVCFWLLQTLAAFAKYMTIASISENIFDLSAMGLLTLFFLLYGKEMNGVETVRNIRLTVPVGLMSSLLCLVCSVPRWVALLSYGFIHGDAEPELLLLYTVMAVSVVFLLPRRISKTK